jgi:small subunit ribosomal protein S6
LRKYEFAYIISPDIEEENLESVTEKVGELITRGGGRVLRLDSWGRRRLAYPIEKFREGHYILAQVELEPRAISELKRTLGLTEEVIRYLLVRIDEEPREGVEIREEPLEEQGPAEDVEAREVGG